jgi:hypothetical protein
VTYWNEGPAIPHLIVRFNSFGALALAGFWARLTIGGRHTHRTPRRLRTFLYRYPVNETHTPERAAFVYVYDLGRIPSRARVYVQANARKVRQRCCGFGFNVVAYARFNAQGLPDARTLINVTGYFSYSDPWHP